MVKIDELIVLSRKISKSTYVNSDQKMCPICKGHKWVEKINKLTLPFPNVLKVDLVPSDSS